MKFSFSSYLPNLPDIIVNMKLSLKEWIILALMIAFIVMPLPIPQFAADQIASVPGVACVLAANVAILVYASPYLGVTAILVASELIRRSYRANETRPGYAPPVARADTNIATRTRPATQSAFTERTLEENIVDKLAPVGKAPVAEFVETDFKPMYDNVHNALMT